MDNEQNRKQMFVRHLKHDRNLEEFKVTKLSPFVIYKDKEIKNKPSIDIDNNIAILPTLEIPIIRLIEDEKVENIPVDNDK